MRKPSVPFAAGLLLSIATSAQQVTIIESISHNSGHVMDSSWVRAADSLGYPYTLEQQAFLDDPANLAATDVLIVSSGVIDFTGTNHRQTIVQYMQSGRAAYIQSEYEATEPGSITYDTVMVALGVPFQWTGSLSGDLAPVITMGALATTPNAIAAINYFWYGCTGTGSGVQPFLSVGNSELGWVYPPLTETTCPQLITCSDQDWIRADSAPELVENILVALAGCLPTSVPDPGIAVAQVRMDAATGVIHATSTAPGSNEFILRDASGREVIRRGFVSAAIIAAPALGAGIYVYELRMFNGRSATGKLARW